MTRPETVTCLCCGVLQKELENLAARPGSDLRLRILDSMLHMAPQKLEKALNSFIRKNPQDAYLLVYGDCHPHMHEMCSRDNVERVKGINCCEILLGREKYRQLQQERAFIFLPEWAARWREIFTHELGFKDPDTARSFLQEHVSKLVFLDTGCVRIPPELTQEIQAFFGLPMEVLPVSLETLSSTIDLARANLAGKSEA